MTAEAKTEALGADRIKRLVIAVSAAIVTIAAVLTFLLALYAFERELLPEMDAKIDAVATGLSGDFDKALDLGIPLDALKGVEPVLVEALQANPEVSYIAVTDSEGTVLFAGGQAADEARVLIEDSPVVRSATHREVGGYRERLMPLRLDGSSEVAGALHVGVSLGFVRDSMRDIALDLAVVLLVSLLATFELLMFFINRTLSGPLSAIARTMREVARGDFSRAVAVRSRDEVGQFVAAIDRVIVDLNRRFHSLAARAADLRDAGRETAAVAGAMERVRAFSFAEGGKPRAMRMQILTDVRMPLLLYVLAGEMSRSFFPNFVKDLYTPIPGLSYEAVLGLPISAFMFFMAAATPVSGGWADRIGPRRLFLLSIIPTLIGLIGTGLAQNFSQLVAFWCLNAVGYAMATIACQSRIAETVTGENRAQGMAVFVTAIMVAAICGTSFGGVISDRIGFRATFLVSSVLVVLSGLIVAAVFVPRDGERSAARRSSTWNALKTAAANGRFAALMVLGAVPAKLILTGFLFYLTPLYLADLGASQSTIGRSMMAYFAIMIVMSPFFAKLADRLKLRLSLVVAGGVIAGAGALAVPVMDSELGALIAIASLGLGHAVGTAPLIAMVPEICHREAASMGPTALLGVLRVVERGGSVLGPIVAGILVSQHGFAAAAQVLGAIVVGSAILLLLIFILSRMMSNPVPVADEAG